jgi:hypothetical protein
MAEKIGILIASDETQEWMLPWWYHHYHQHNSLPVTFVDLGLSKNALSWCQKKGHVISLDIPQNFVFPKEKIEKKWIADWEQLYGQQIWQLRPKWFLKPLFLPKSPYQKTLYLDTDCEVKENLESLFSYLNNGTEVALARCIRSPHVKTRKVVKKILTKEEIHFNSGVILYNKASDLIQQYYHRALQENHLYPGDQELLGNILYQAQKGVCILPQKFNYQKIDFNNRNFQKASIRHWAGRAEKILILKQCRFLANSSFLEFNHFF